MVYAILADLIVVIHLLFIIFVGIGSLLGFYRIWQLWLHLPAAIWGILLELFGWICPLTPLEKWLRCSAGGTAYEGGFIAHYITSIIYPEGLTRNIQIGLGITVFLFNAAVYSYLIYRWWRKQKNETH